MNVTSSPFLIFRQPNGSYLDRISLATVSVLTYYHLAYNKKVHVITTPYDRCIRWLKMIDSSRQVLARLVMTIWTCHLFVLFVFLTVIQCYWNDLLLTQKMGARRDTQWSSTSMNTYLKGSLFKWFDAFASLNGFIHLTWPKDIFCQLYENKDRSCSNLLYEIIRCRL